MTTSCINSRTPTRGNVWRGAVLLVACLAGGTQANAVGARWRDSVITGPIAARTWGRTELRQCMRANCAKLSGQCVRALVADGEISEAEVARRAASGGMPQTFAHLS